MMKIVSKQQSTMRRWLNEFFMSVADRTMTERTLPMTPTTPTPTWCSDLSGVKKSIVGSRGIESNQLITMRRSPSFSQAKRGLLFTKRFGQQFVLRPETQRSKTSNDKRSNDEVRAAFYEQKCRSQLAIVWYAFADGRIEEKQIFQKQGVF